MAEGLPVVAAIPNYNMGAHLRRLIPQALAQNYDAVFVLDDASTDDTVAVVREFGDDVKFVSRGENRGAGANRNQIIDHVPDDVIIHFIDADMDLETPETPLVARTLMERYAASGVGAIGGLVSRNDGTQEPYNYGPVFSLWGNTVAGFLPAMFDRMRDRPRLASAIHRAVAPMMRGCPYVLAPPVAEPAYWLHEGNMLIRSNFFRAVGGYNPILRSHEAQDLAIRLEKIGVKRQFDPSIGVFHHHIDVRGRNRSKWESAARNHLIREHGVYRFLTDH
ncbi:glycosyltransferase family 2 protein [Mycolicibacterium sp. Dal123E01]|uniref:glycosyltransferase family 2 protein n=1 Tax=Mycolicibacterium sp. Dal123E01 TaxID=3457578 RepID=UPI00403E7355